MNRFILITCIILAASATLLSCAPVAAPISPGSAPVVQTVVVSQQQTVVVPQTVIAQQVVTATPAPTAAPKQGGTLIAARAADAKGLDPHKQTAFSSFRMLELMYESLLSFDKDLNVIPGLATDWKWAEDGKTLTMTLRQNVKFHTGNPMTSDDVKFSFNRILDEKTGAAARSTFSSIQSIDTPDAQTVVFHLNAPNAALLAAMTNPNSAILDSKAVNGGTDPAQTDVGTGAFKLSDWQPDKVMKMVANKDYWQPGVPHLDGIEFRTIPDESSILAGLRAGTLDWAIINDPRVAIRAGAGGSNMVVSRAPSLAYHVLQLNAGRDMFKEPSVRQAISCAIDRQQVLDVASLGEGQVTGPATPPLYRLPTDQLTCYQKDLDKAKQLLQQANVTNLSFKIMAANDEPPTAVAEAQNIQAQLKELGINTEIETLELGVYVDRWLKGDFDATIALNGGNPDPDNMFYRYWYSTGNLNKVAAYSDPAIDKLLDQGRATTDSAQRKQIYDQIQKMLVDAAPWVWLYNGFEYRVMQPYVMNYTSLANGATYYLRDVWLNK